MLEDNAQWLLQCVTRALIGGEGSGRDSDHDGLEYKSLCEPIDRIIDGEIRELEGNG
ncbi:MAG TPA: hypothetical protein VM163_09915 [bacterium]|nr:hypothetical protein [bacterium]